MTSAELKTIRESLGLPVPWLARAAGVKDRTVNYWESGRNAVPDDVAKMMTGLVSIADALVAEYSRIFEAEVIPGNLVLLRYRTDADLWESQPEFMAMNLPTTFHAALLLRVKDIAEKAGVSVTIIYFERDAYLKWLGGRENTPDRRIEWATSSLR